MASFLPLVLIVVAFFFLLIRPQRARQRQMRQVQASLAPGAQVLTSSGVFATVTDIDDEAVTLEISPGVRVRFVRGAIATVVTPVAGPMDDTAIELPPDDRPPA